MGSQLDIRSWDPPINETRLFIWSIITQPSRTGDRLVLLTFTHLFPPLS